MEIGVADNTVERRGHDRIGNETTGDHKRGKDKGGEDKKSRRVREIRSIWTERHTYTVTESGKRQWVIEKLG